MKILYHHRTQANDGQGVHIRAIVSALRDLGHDVILVGPQAAGPGRERLLRLRRRMPGVLHVLGEMTFGVLDWWRLRAVLRRHRPDVIYERYNLFLPGGGLLRRRYGVPLLLEVNAPLAAERQHYGGLAWPRLAFWIERWTWRQADKVLPVTDALAAHVRAAGVGDARIQVIANGVHRDFLQAPGAGDAKRRALGLTGRIVLGFTGFVREWHGLSEVVEMLPALAREHDVHLLVVGDGPIRGEIEARASALRVPDRVSFTGVVPPEALCAYIDSFDIALQPNVVPYASPLKLVEYMARGRAILAPDTPNIREILHDGQDALLFRSGDPADMLRGLQRLCGDRGLRERIGCRARRAVVQRDLTWEGNAARIVDLADKQLRPAQARREPPMPSPSATSSGL